MFLRALILVYIFDFATNARIASGPDRKIVKRGDIDLQTCINNFDIHTDKIIRTQDSRDMGAKYLNEIDLGSREECLRLCCETENCDVFVFEEKNSGSCYLFHCGPPEDFKCKFTHHVNYSSAVLAINRHLPDLESQIKLTKHEQDLTELRKPETDPVPNAAPVKTTPPTIATTRSKELLPAIMRTKPPEIGRKCHRYQFECRSTGDCIAIYNACDGIPQCADGSDEAPELGCPGSVTTVPPAPVHPNPPSNVIYNQNNQQSSVIQPPPIGNLPVQDPYRPVLPPSGVNQQPVAVHHRQEDFLRPVGDSRAPMPPQASVYEPPRIPQYAPLSPQNDNGWIPHQSNQMPPQIPQYVDKNSHIFNHKENGLQVTDGQETSQMQYPEASNVRDYQKIQNYYGDMYNRQAVPVMHDNWAEDSRYIPNNINSNNMNGNQQIPENEWKHQIATEQNIKDETNKHSEETKEPPKAILTAKVENPPHIQKSMEQDLKNSKDHMEHGTAESKKIKIEKQGQTHKEADEKEYPDVVAYKVVDSFEDGAAETPSGAILSLTLGLIITCVMAILIGCRLRVVRRRMRKCGKSYAHDADYLVNGMYL